jgi:hypothetical protein
MRVGTCPNDLRRFASTVHDRPDRWTLAHASKPGARQSVAGMVVAEKNRRIRKSASGARKAPFSGRF